MVCATFLLVGMISVYCRDSILEGCCERLRLSGQVPSPSHYSITYTVVEE